MKCAYCDETKCHCGGRREVVSRPKGRRDGEVKIVCKRCGNTWLHWHDGNRGTARPM